MLPGYCRGGGGCAVAGSSASGRTEVVWWVAGCERETAQVPAYGFQRRARYGRRTQLRTPGVPILGNRWTEGASFGY